MFGRVVRRVGKNRNSRSLKKTDFCLFQWRFGFCKSDLKETLIRRLRRKKETEKRLDWRELAFDLGMQTTVWPITQQFFEPSSPPIDDFLQFKNLCILTATRSIGMYKDRLHLFLTKPLYREKNNLSCEPLNLSKKVFGFANIRAHAQTLIDRREVKIGATLFGKNALGKASPQQSKIVETKNRDFVDFSTATKSLLLTIWIKTGANPQKRE